jgi:hypothetical protein
MAGSAEAAAMRIDQTHRTWAIASGVILGAAILLWFPYALLYPGGPGGNTWPGLIYGVLGYAMMLFAGLMGARKRVPLWRVGRAQAWMRGHIWLGALSLPMILLHSAFVARGPLAMVLMALLVITVLSGITGAILQHFVPGQILAAVPLETIYEQIPEVRDQLFEEATEIINKLCARPDEVALAVSSGVISPGIGGAVVAEPDTATELTEVQRLVLRQVYSASILPFLRDPDHSGSPLSDFTKASLYFDAMRRQMPVSVHQEVTDLEQICEEERQLKRQARKYLWLHGWLLVHVPLSLTLLVLGGIHAFVAIHY